MYDLEQMVIGSMHSDHIGDDGAVIGHTIYSADALCEDVHFRRAWMTPAQIGRKAMLVNLSDAVAMNATPQYALVTLSLPKNFSETDTRELVASMEATAAEWGCEIIGGDTVGGDRLHLSVTLISHSDTPLLRTGLEAGDLLAYTGRLGGSLRDLQRLEAGESISEDSRFFVPTLRADFIRRTRPHIHAGMDISDGLFCDTNTLLDANGVGMNLFREIDNDIGNSGEEYEMLIGCAPAELSAVQSWADLTGISIQVFAEVAHNTERFSCKSHHFG